MSRLLRMVARTFFSFQALSAFLSRDSLGSSDSFCSMNREHGEGQTIVHDSVHTSHLRSNVEVFVYAFFSRKIVASFFAATRMGSFESSADRYSRDFSPVNTRGFRDEDVSKNIRTIGNTV
jgi:hypothetical protein